MRHQNQLAFLAALLTSICAGPTLADARTPAAVIAANSSSRSDAGPPVAPYVAATIEPTFIGDPAVGLSVDLTFTYASPEQLLLENLNAVEGPIEIASELGFEEWPGAFEPLLEAYFALHPEVDFAVAWWSGPPGGNALLHTINSDVKTVGPADVCDVAAAVSALQSIGGSPLVGAGVAGILLKAVKTKNAVELFVEKGGAEILEVGHTFVKLAPDGGAGTFHGFYPKKLTLDNLHKEIDAELGDDKDHDWSYKVAWLVTTENYNSAAKFVKSELADRGAGTLRKYFLLDLALGGAENCTSWGVSVTGKAGLTSPNAKTGLFGAGIYDPKALNKSLVTVGDGNLFNGCGKVTKKPAAAPPPDGDASSPLDFSPEDLLLRSLEEPAAIAAIFGAVHSDEVGEPLLVDPASQLQVTFSGAPAGEFTALVDWGNGEYSLVNDGIAAAHAAPLVDGVVRIVIFENGSVQRTTIPIELLAGGDLAPTLLLVVEDFPATESPNGPFLPSVEPTILGLDSCLTDCNADGVPDCKQVDPATGGDCDGNGQLDACDIAEGTLVDANLDGVPDACQCLGDLNRDGVVDGADLAILLASWMNVGPADLNGDGQVDSSDLGVLLSAWGPC